MSENLLGIPATYLPPDPAADGLAQGQDARTLAAAYPSSSLAWAELAEAALEDDLDVEAYAFARTGYHRGLDALRQAGWRGQGPVPWEHEPNQGFLRALAALARSAARVGEDAEHRRCSDFLRDSSWAGAEQLRVVD